MISSLVVDASVGIKVRVAEPLSDRATALLRTSSAGAVFFVPDLFFVECANILWKYVQRTGYFDETARTDMADLRRLPLTVVSTRDLAEDAYALAAARGISAYDACYLVLAIRESIPLITADEKLLRKLDKSGLPIRFLGDITDNDLAG